MVSIQNAVAPDNATDEEKALPIAWKTYCVTVNRLDVNKQQ
ncbi:tail fiber assembly protein [Tenebrionibacter intestinalis]